MKPDMPNFAASTVRIARILRWGANDFENDFVKEKRRQPVCDHFVRKKDRHMTQNKLSIRFRLSFVLKWIGKDESDNGKNGKFR